MPTLPPNHALVVEASVARDATAMDVPVTTAALRDASGATRTVRVVGGPNRFGGETRIAGLVVPRAGMIVRADLRESSSPRVAWTPGTPPAIWPSSSLPVTFALALPATRAIAQADVVAELDIAIRTWPLVRCTSWRATLGGSTQAPAGDDGVNAVYFHDDAWPAELGAGALAQTVLHTDGSGRLRDADIHVNSADYRYALDGGGATFDLRGILVHELGHALGLGHSTVPGATMYATPPPGPAARSLEQDDRDGVCALYPGTGAPGCESGPPCPSGFACVARACERPGEASNVCSPCVREIGACAGAGDDARCIDYPGGMACGRACVDDGDCGPRFRCAPTTASGDLQCVANDACGIVPTADAGSDAATPDAASAAAPSSASGGCAIANGAHGSRMSLAFVALALALCARRQRME